MTMNCQLIIHSEEVNNMKKVTIRTDNQTEPLLDVFLKLRKENPKLFDYKYPRSMNEVYNQLLKDYLSILLTAWDKHPNSKYSTIYKNLMSMNGNSDWDKLTKRIDNLNDLMNKLYYLQIYSNQNMIYDFNETIQKAISIFDEKSPVFIQNLQLKQLVDDDKKYLFAMKQKERKDQSNL